MTRTFDIAVIAGSLRAEGLTASVSQAMIRLVPPSFRLFPVSLGALPIYNSDLEEGGAVVDAWNDFRQQVRPADGVLFITPEYNRSVPAPLKNAIDVGSRPYAQSVWSGKPAGIISVSPGHMGAFGANHHLRQSLVFLDMPVLQQPEAYLGNADTLFMPDRSASTDKVLSAFAEAFERWVARQLALEPALS